jgi:copper chaperone CopZ
METMKFKTNIKCSGCVATVTPHLDKVAGKENWEVDLQSPDKTLVVASDKPLSEEDIITAMREAGYKAEKA